MEHYTIENDIICFGEAVTTFPDGIGATFDKLVDMLPKDQRPYYGISQGKTGSIEYIAAAQEIFEGEAEKYNCQRYTIEKGNYLCVQVFDWSKKTDSIKYVFMELTKHELADLSKPCIEIYKDMQELLCLVKVRT
jgi:hypothetical protein